MNIKLGDLVETATGAVAVAVSVGLVCLLGNWAGPHLQWVPAVRDLQHHAWYSNAVHATDGAARAFYVGTLVIFAGFLTAVGLCVPGAAALSLRDFGRLVLQRQATDADAL